jgi:hypothetical protein
MYWPHANTKQLTNFPQKTSPTKHFFFVFSIPTPRHAPCKDVHKSGEENRAQNPEKFGMLKRPAWVARAPGDVSRPNATGVDLRR